MSTIADHSFRRHAFTVKNYHQMAELGILSPDARVELIDGEIIDMSPTGSRHAGTVEHLATILRAAVGVRAMVRVQHPIALGEFSEPVPDIALARPRRDYYKSAHPGPADILLIVEVAETTLRYDRKRKVPLYARHGIVEYWIVDLERGLLERYRAPHESTYVRADQPDIRAPISLAAMPDLRLDLAGVFDA